MASLRFYDLTRGAPTVAGIILFGKNPLFHLPGASVTFLHFPGSTLTDRPDDELVASGDLQTVVETVIQKMRSYNRIAPTAGDGFREGSAADYVLMSFGVRDNRPVRAYEDWIAQIPQVYRDVVLDRPGEISPAPDPDPYRLASLKHYRSLMPLAMTARKPMFLLRPADGARGAHLDAVSACYEDFLRLARGIGDKLGVHVP